MLPLPLDTRRALGLADDVESAANAANCESRSLLLERYANPQLEKEARNNFFRAVARRPSREDHATAWLRFLQTGLGLANSVLLFAQLQSRLMVNMAGGAMENAGLCLDRFSGLPVIPGSAAKACARRMATQQLLDRSAEAPSASADELASLLAEIALAFGWTDSDWKSGRKQKWKDAKVFEAEPHSDFWWAMATDVGDHSADGQRSARWAEVSEKTAADLFETLRTRPRDSEKPLAPQLPNFAGTVSFLPAWPVKVSTENLPAGVPPELGRLELDVVTCHHGKYYNGDPNYASAPDIEDPVPVVFPAVAPAHVFVFALLPLRSCPTDLVAKARSWLATGLATFGLGAKTAAGYGWFEDVGQQVVPWWELEVAVARLKAEHRDFPSYPDTQKDEVVLNLSEQPAVCKVWSESEPASFEPVKQYATSQGIQLV